jgi:cytidine deaminase
MDGRAHRGRIVHGYCNRVDERALAATVASCKDLIDSRFPDDGENGAAAMLLGDGTILTGTAPDAVNASVEVCHEVEPYCGAYRLNQRVVASVWKTLRDVLPDYWKTAFPDEIDAGWTT